MLEHLSGSAPSGFLSDGVEQIARLLHDHSRAVLTMRRAFQEDRFGLVLGAGVSRAFAFSVPDWRGLLARIAADSRVAGHDVDSPDSTPTARADILYQHFLAKQIPRLREQYGIGPGSSRLDHVTVERAARAEWRQMIRNVLYEHAVTPDKLFESHPFLGEYLEIVLRSPLTITYNFDNYLEQMLAAGVRRRSSLRGRGFETVFEGYAPVRSRNGVIYHPNGYLPQSILETSSERLVFSEEEFGDQLMDSVAGRYSSLGYHLSKNISLFMGLSLADENLRYFLRRNAVHNPGHHHYFVEYLRREDEIPTERRNALFNYRFNTYNIITLFLTNEGLASLGQLIKADRPDFLEIAERLSVRTKHVYYLTGVPGIGKTTALHHLASLGVYDEWMGDPNPLLAKPHSELLDSEREQLDQWVALEMRKKNEALTNEPEGVLVVERAPLDPLSFEEYERIPAKARRLAGYVTPTQGEKLQEGDVILMWGDPNVVSSRIAGRQTIAQRADYLRDLQTRLKERIYAIPDVHSLHSTEWSINELAKRVAEVIHLERSSPLDLQSQLQILQQS
jgi:dephospho-CoA kinase